MADQDFDDEEGLCPLFRTKMPENPEDDEVIAAMQSLTYDNSSPEEVAEHWKEQGNNLIREGKPKYYKDALVYYSKALSENSPNKINNSIYYCNRAYANLLLGNDRNATQDSQFAIALNPINIKAYYRGSLSNFKRENFDEAMSMCHDGLKIDPQNTDLLKLEKQIAEQRKLYLKREKKQSSEEKKKQIHKEKLQAAMEDRHLVVGLPLPHLACQMADYTNNGSIWYDDRSDTLHYPLIMLYDEVMQSDFVQDSSENTSLGQHFEEMFPDSGPALPWDPEHNFRASQLEAFVANVDISAEFELKRVDVNVPLRSVLQNITIPQLPVFYVRASK